MWQLIVINLCVSARIKGGEKQTRLLIGQIARVMKDQHRPLTDTKWVVKRRKINTRLVFLEREKKFAWRLLKYGYVARVMIGHGSISRVAVNRVVVERWELHIVRTWDKLEAEALWVVINIERNRLIVLWRRLSIVWQSRDCHRAKCLRHFSPHRVSALSDALFTLSLSLFLSHVLSSLLIFSSLAGGL